MLLGLFILLSLPGLIVALVVRAWGIRHGWDRTSRATWFALIIGLLCSPGIYVGESVIPAIAVTPALLAAVLNYNKNGVWAIFFVSSTITGILSFAVYSVMSKAKVEDDCADNVEQNQ